MNHLFVPYDVALKLKEKGFDEPCFGTYYSNGELDWLKYKDCQVKEPKSFCSAPLYQQVFAWFREKHQLSPNIIRKDNAWFFVGVGSQGVFTTYEGAELACINKMLELI